MTSRGVAISLCTGWVRLWANIWTEKNIRNVPFMLFLFVLRQRNLSVYSPVRAADRTCATPLCYAKKTQFDHQCNSTGCVLSSSFSSVHGSWTVGLLENLWPNDWRESKNLKDGKDRWWEGVKRKKLMSYGEQEEWEVVNEMEGNKFWGKVVRVRAHLTADSGKLFIFQIQ